MSEGDHARGCQRCEELVALERKAYAAAQQAIRARDDFFLTLSHELRGPLSAIMGWVYLLRSGKLAPTETARALEIVERNADAEARLITDMLDVSRIISGQLRLIRAPVDLATFVTQSADSLRPRADRAGIAVDIDCEATDRVITADADRLRQVIENLLINAIKFSSAGGRITARVSYDAASAMIAVSDDGEGIAPDLLPHVFERFRQGPSASNLEGLGLGLSIVQHLVELHGGSVTATSKGEGLGATFCVTLPLSVMGDVDGGAAAAGDGARASAGTR